MNLNKHSATRESIIKKMADSYWAQGANPDHARALAETTLAEVESAVESTVEDLFIIIEKELAEEDDRADKTMKPKEPPVVALGQGDYIRRYRDAEINRLSNLVIILAAAFILTNAAWWINKMIGGAP